MKTGLLLAAFFLISFLSSAQADTAYAKQWQEIDSLITLKDLPKTALAKVKFIYADAKKKQLHSQILKSLLYELSLQEKSEEADINRDVALLKSELQTTRHQPMKAVLYLMLAKELDNYQRQNFWSNQGRTDIKENEDTDITAWPNAKLTRNIDSCYNEALRNTDLLQKTQLADMNAVIIKGNAGNTRPTLYDVVAQEALDYYESILPYVTEPSRLIAADDSLILAQTDIFIQHSFTAKDTSSHLLKAVWLFQQLLRFHKSDADPATFVDVAIQRVRWAYGRAGTDNKDSLYKTALQYLADKFSDTKPGAEAWYFLAYAEADKADSYSPFTDTINRYGYVKAKALIEKRLQTMPAACYGNREMKVLLSNITRQELSTRAEEVNVPGKPFRVLVEYKNIDTLYVRILGRRVVDKAAEQKEWDRWKDISRLPYIKAYSQLLPETNDYQKHSAEIKIDTLPPGDYVLLFSNGAAFSNRGYRMATQEVSVSRLAYMHNNEDYFVVDRETGQPLKGVKVTSSLQVQNSKQGTKKTATLFTDAFGHARLPVETKKTYSYRNAWITFQKDNDTLTADDNLYRYSYNNDDNEEDDDTTYEEDHSYVSLFTDRSIYRPGQTVWFKGIVTTRDRKTKKNKLYHYTDSIEVDLYDANSKQVDSIFVMLNEYGSFSGRFVLPQQVLTGEFSIETVDIEEGEVKFSVEEYKRPLFHIDFDTLKGSYRLYDTLVMTGSVKAFAGNAVDGAKVTYHIVRSASFPHPYLLRNRVRPYSRSTEIADSTVSTDADGNFIIRFVASPDSSVNRNTEPLFDFSVALSVTDANGETHEANTNVEVAYQALQLQLDVPGTTEVSRFKNLFVTTKNSAEQNIPASVKLIISPLQPPGKAYRERLWNRPDQYVMSREEFEASFPYDEYGEETDYQNWKKSDAIITDTFNTTYTSSYTLPKTLQQGWYSIEATAKDKDGSDIKDVKYIQLYDMNAAGLPSPQTDFSLVLRNTGMPGDKVKFLLGSSEPDVFAITQIRKGGEASNGVFSYTTLNNSKKEIAYTIQPGDDNNIGMYYGFIKHNRFYNGGMQVYINHDEQQLNITYATYRNRTEPSSKETWTVQVADSSNKTAGAELLTGMYDASLDQFRKHRWEVPSGRQQPYVSNDWQSSSFQQSYSDENSEYGRLYSRPKVYDHIAGSAYEFWVLYRNKKQVMIVQYTPPRIVADEEADASGLPALSQYDMEYDSVGDVTHMKMSFQHDMNPGASFALSGRVSGLSGNLSEVIVTSAMGVSKKKDITGSVAVVTTQSLSDTGYVRSKIRSLAGVQNIDALLVVIDNVATDKKLSSVDLSAVDHIEAFKSSEAMALYGSKAAGGAVLIITKDFALRNGKQPEEPQIQVRRNFSETAFFYPQLHADSSGNYSFSFTMPDAVTTWKWMSLAHTKNLQYGYHAQNILSQKTVMVQPNLPRFLREGDSILVTAKISNLSDSLIDGNASLVITDAITDQTLNHSLHISSSSALFSVAAGRSSVISFPLQIPSSFTHPIAIKITAIAGRFSDGEEKVLPVLSRRQLVTETLPLFMNGNGEKHIVWNKLANAHSSTLTNESLTVEYTPNPVWQVVQSLPYLMEYPHQCVEQTFNRFYANALGSYIVATHPYIRQVFSAWQSDSTAMQSKLEASPELKNLLVNETPWVSDATDERVQKKNIAMLFNEARLSAERSSAIEQLKDMQLGSGAFPWFDGGNADRYITQYILTGIGKLQRLHTLAKTEQSTLDDIITKALYYLDKETEKEYAEHVKHKTEAASAYLPETDIQYWYMRSFFTEKKQGLSAEAFSFFVQQAEAQRSKQTPYMQGMIALSLKRLSGITKNAANSNRLAVDIIHSLEENAVTDSIKGMYWKANEDGYRWYQSAIEAQALLIDAFTEIAPRDSSVSAMQQWLIMNRQTHHWSTTKSTADACYALLHNQPLDSPYHTQVIIRTGDSSISTLQEKQAAGDGYIKHRIEGNGITTAMGNISLSVSKASSHSSSYGAVYWQYFEDMDNITAASSSPLSVSRALFIETNAAAGKQLQPVSEKKKMMVGDKLVVRLTVKSDRDMEYIQLTDTRAATMEPVTVLSGYRWQDGLGYYQSTKDVSTNFFIDHLPKGTYVLEYPVYITHSGYYSAGLATLQCMYAPQFASHSEGASVEVSAREK